MADTFYIDHSTPLINAEWLNEVNTKTFHDTASFVANSPSGNIVSLTVQGAINELDTSKATIADAVAVNQVHNATSKTTPADNDETLLADSAASYGIKKLTWANTKATLVAYLSALTSTWAISTTGNAATATSATSATTATTATSLGQGTQGYTLVAEQATTSGTSKDFTGIPSWATKIYVHLNGVSTNGTSKIMMQIGDSGGIEITGYLGGATDLPTTFSAAGALETTGFAFESVSAAGSIRHGTATLTLQKSSTFRWGFTSIVNLSDTPNTKIGSGVKATSAALDRVRLTTFNGTDTFDAGSVSIAYE